MISDHGEDNIEHRQTGKNNMYDSASRVAMILSGPGIKPQQVRRSTEPRSHFPRNYGPKLCSNIGLLAGAGLLEHVDVTQRCLSDDHGSSFPAACLALVFFVSVSSFS